MAAGARRQGYPVHPAQQISQVGLAPRQKPIERAPCPQKRMAQDGEAAVSPQAGELPPAGPSASAPAGYGGAVDAVGMAEFSARQTDGGTASAEPPA